ncbi:MAG: hypothetical protein ABI211_17515 [Vicinamibacterales bacterium]
MSTSNPYCAALGIPVPRIEDVKSHPDANYYSLFLVALLERGEPMTLEDVAVRLAAAGIAPVGEALASLKRCKPGRPPIYRDGDLYALAPHEDEAGLWAFRLGLRPPRVAPIQLVPPTPAALPSPDQPLSIAALDEAWRNGVPSAWSAQRVAIAVLDAHGRAMPPEEVLAFVGARTQWSLLRAESPEYWHSGHAVGVQTSGQWTLDRTHPAVRSAREAVRERLLTLRRWAQPDPAAIAATQRRIERERRAHAEQLARLRRVIVHAFPASQPEALVLADIGERRITTFIGDEIGQAIEEMAAYELIAGVEIRALLRTLRIPSGEMRLAELGPPQRSMRINGRGRTLKITTALLIQGSCGISRPFGDESTLRGYLEGRSHGKLRRRLEADARSLVALDQYGRVHGAVRVRWGFMDEMLPVPWVHRDEPTLHDLMKDAYARQVPLDVVVGSAPGWSDRWARAQSAHVVADAWGWPAFLVDDEGVEIARAEVQLARVPKLR